MSLFAGARAVFFDMDNTLYDFEESMSHAFHDLCGAFPDPLGRVGVESLAKAYWDHYHAYPADEKWDLVRKDPERYRLLMWAGALRALRLADGVDDALAVAVTDTFARMRADHLRRAVYPGAFDLVARLREAYTVGVITNGPPLVQRPKLEAFGYRRLFADRVVFVSGEFGVDKPDPSIFLAAAEAAGARPEECVMVGDAREYDMPAKAVGFRTVLFDGKRLAPDCSKDPYPPDAVVATYGDLAKLL